MLPKPKRVVSIPGLHSSMVVNEHDNNDEKELCVDPKLLYLLMLCQTLILPSSTLFFSQSSPAFLASSLNSGDAAGGQNHKKVTDNFIQFHRNGFCWLENIWLPGCHGWGPALVRSPMPEWIQTQYCTVAEYLILQIVDKWYNHISSRCHRSHLLEKHWSPQVSWTENREDGPEEKFTLATPSLFLARSPASWSWQGCSWRMSELCPLLSLWHPTPGRQ